MIDDFDSFDAEIQDTSVQNRENYGDYVFHFTKNQILREHKVREGHNKQEDQSWSYTGSHIGKERLKSV